MTTHICQRTHTLPRLAHWRVLPFFLLLFLHGCALFQPTVTPPPAGTEVDWVSHIRSLTLLQEWQVQGKIGVRTADDAGSAYIDWNQAQDSFYITLSGPLGQGTTIVSGNPTGARLQQSEGTWIAESPDQLVLDHTGWQIPISSLLYWVKGMPAPGSQPVLSHNELGTLASLQQDGWQLTFDQYSQQLGTLLPHRIRAQKDTLKVTLIIKRWQPLAEDAGA